MKKRMILLLLVSLALLPLFSRPQFFAGGGLGWGRMYLSENETEILDGNIRYEKGEYISDALPFLEFTYLPVADLGLGVSGELGYGRVLGCNDGNTTYSNNEKGYSFRTDSILDASLGLRYIQLMAKEKYVSFSAFLQYNYRRYSLVSDVESAKSLWAVKDISGHERDVISLHSIEAGIGLMERYDKYYFRIDLGVAKALDFSDGFASLGHSGWSAKVSASFGFVFTILNENEFMR